MFRPPIIAPFICSSANCAPSGISYSTKANPLCFCVMGSHDILIDLMGPNGRKAPRIVSSFSSNDILPTYTLRNKRQWFVSMGQPRYGFWSAMILCENSQILSANLCMNQIQRNSSDKFQDSTLNHIFFLFIITEFSRNVFFF